MPDGSEVDIARMLPHLVRARFIRMTEGRPERRKRLSSQARREVIERAATEVFAEHGYHGASVDEIARRSGISIPVLYDHFASKHELHRHLLERHFADLRAIWHEYLVNDRPVEQRIAETVDAWFGYVEANPYAWRMLFRDTNGQDEIETMRREIADRSRARASADASTARGGDRHGHALGRRGTSPERRTLANPSLVTA